MKASSKIVFSGTLTLKDTPLSSYDVCNAIVVYRPQHMTSSILVCRTIRVSALFLINETATMIDPCINIRKTDTYYIHVYMQHISLNVT